MEATGRDGGRGPSWSWSYRRQKETGTESSSHTVSSSRSGTIVSSTAYTSSASRMSSVSMQLELELESELRVGMPGICMESALLQVDLEHRVGMPWIESDETDAEFLQPIKKPRKETGETLKEKKMMKHMENLVQEFFREPSENRSILGGGGMNALERWFSELGVRWVLLLDVADYASAWVHGHPTPTIDEIWSWSRALTEIMETIRLTTSFFPHHGHGFVGMPGISEQEEELPHPESGKHATTSLKPLQFALFFQETMSKMLVFVDIMFSYSLFIHGVAYVYDSFIPCLHLHGALSKALLGIKLQFHSTPSAQVEKIKNEMVSLLSEKQGKAFEAIWSTLEEIRTGVIKRMDTQTPQRSSDILKATYSVMDDINFLLCNHSTVNPLVSEAASLGKYVPLTGLGEAPPFISLIAEMVSCLEEKLITQLFLDQGLSFLFSLNNLNFIREQLEYSYIKVDVATITRKVDHYIESYIQVSWGQVLSCLFNPTPLYLVTKYSPLSKFESEFQKTYTTQKLWKVPDPELRKRLRKSVIEKIIPGYTKYIEDSKVTNPKFTPQELEEMLQELFEG